ncbi:MAG TPA: helix-turn-helix transcriptional regulator [Planctomycetota bacterium]|nr:helix-turn-helix transcriptional regulator [Planctomycetota bacterium]
MHTRTRASHGNPLLPLEEAILTTIAAGCSDQETADRLGIGLGAVRTFLDRLARKLGARSRAEALNRFAAGFGA